MDLKLNVFTLNCWGIPLVSKNRAERMRAIAKYLSDGKHNIVCLQELWSEHDFVYIKNVIKKVLPYSHYFYSGVLGSGLCVFSAWPIEDVFFHQWPLNGYVHKVHHGDWFGGKGVGLCRIRCGEWLLNVFCTHLHAQYHPDDIYLAHRTMQAYATAEFIKLTSTAGDATLLAGDFNVEPGSLSYRLITQVASLLDPFDLVSESPDATMRASGTCDHAGNSYSNMAEVEKLPEGKRIDHILYQNRPCVKVDVLNFGNPLSDRVPGQPFSYSDHNAVSLEINLSKLKDRPPQKRATDMEGVLKSLEEAVAVIEEANSDLHYAKKTFLFLGAILFFLFLSSTDVWTHTIVLDTFRLLVALCGFYCTVMGTLWNMTEVNSIKAGLTALENKLNCLKGH